jgi:L-ascorbate metabolism protein UlaG (beta-lactamase superfamily)
MFLKALGKNPSGNELKKVEASPNYKNKSFQNLMQTSMMENTSMFSIMWKFMNKPKNTAPPKPLPSVKTDLKSLPDGAPVIVWFGHSSYLIKINGKYILVDPVLSGHASPFSFTAKSFPGTDIYTVEDLPPIDMLIISHDHYDHMDYKAIKKLVPKTKLICTSLGVASHLNYWGLNNTRIIEFDWWDSHELLNDMQLTAVPARHFSGRSFVRSKTLWSSFVLQSGQYSLFIGADSGYGDHFKAIQQKFGSFDLAILECGQYNIAWHSIHMLPEETAQASIDLHAKVLMPVHWGKFSISLHPWDEPVRRVLAKAGELNIKVTTPMIGESVTIGGVYPEKRWWELE